MPSEACSPEQLLKRLDNLLGDETSCSWADVLATAMALREKAVIMPEAADLVHALDTRVISKAYMEQGRPGMSGCWARCLGLQARPCSRRKHVRTSSLC
jgi:hypothetical protein